MSATFDPSRRFVRPQGDAFVKNLAALWMADPALAGRIEALEEDAAHRVEPSKSGPPTVAVTADGRSLYLHSRYQPIEEARRLVEAVNTDERLAFYVQGFGLGYHVEALVERISDEAIVCVFEPDLVLLKTAFQHRDFSALIESGRLLYFTELDKTDLFTRLMQRSGMLSMGFESVTHAPSLQARGEFHKQMQTWIAEFASYCRTSINTLIVNGRRTAENIARNLGWYVATPSVARLKDRYQGKPGIIISAGPSLRKNKHLLGDLQDRAVLIAVQTMLKPLLEMGVEPHFVTSLDYHDVCTQFFEGLPRSLQTELVAEPKATNKIFDINPGPLTILGNDFAEALLREMKLNKGTLISGATVAHLAYYLAEHLGCDPIIFVGQDLGFSDGLCYAPGTSYEDVWRPEFSRFCTIEMKQWEQVVRERNILRKIPDVEGRPMYTEERLFTYLQQFERDFGKSTRKLIDATEGGALKRGTTPMKLSEVVSQYCQQSLPATIDDHPGLRWDQLGQSIACLEKRKGEARQIEQVSRETLPLLQDVRDHLQDQSRVNRAIARIDSLRHRMNGLSGCYDLILQLTQLTELQRFQEDRKISAAKVEGIELQRRQVNRDIENVRGVAEAAGEFQKLMDEVIVELTRLESLRSRGQREVAA